MSEFNNQRKPISAYQELSTILNALKAEEMSLKDAMHKIQLKESRPTRPYCKVTGSGALALYGISKQPLVMYADQWTKLLKVCKSEYMDNYIKYNESKLKFKKKFVKSDIEKNNNTTNEENNGNDENLEEVDKV